MDDRAVVLDADAEGNALNNRALQDASYRGSTEGIVFGDIGYALGAPGILTRTSQPSPTATVPRRVGSSINRTRQSAIRPSPSTPGATDPVEGDIFTVAGSTQQFVVSSYSSNVITFAPALTAALSNNSALTFAASHVVNVAFQRQAFGFAMAPIMDASMNSDTMRQVTDESRA